MVLYIDKAGFGHLPLDQLGRQRQVGENVAESPCGLGVFPLLFYDVPIDGYDSTISHGSSPSIGVDVGELTLTT